MIQTFLDTEIWKVCARHLIHEIRSKIYIAFLKKDYKLAQKRGLDIVALEKVIEILAEGETLPVENHDHPLIGNYKGCRECHITPDWLLIYKLFESVLVLELSRRVLIVICTARPIIP